jgi:hypothetical protein
MATSAIMLFTLLARYRICYIERYIQMSLYHEGRFMDPSDYLVYILEVLLNCFFMPPVVKGAQKTDMLGGIYSFNVDSLVAIFSVLRIYHFVRVYVHYSVWFTGETQLICKKLASYQTCTS